MKTTLKWVIVGKVQGVGFRNACLQEALKISQISGWVKNMNNGSVEVVAQGEEKRILKLKAWCMKGPILAAVEDLTEEDISHQDKLLEPFTVK